MNRILAAIVALVAMGAGAYAQAPTTVRICNGTQPGCPLVGAANPLAVTGTFSATLGGFAPVTQGTPVAATTGGNTQTLPAGAVVVATNVGATNAAYCKLGASSDTGAQYIAPNGGWFAFTVGAATQLTCVTSTSTTTVNTVGGSGLATGTGGGSGGGGGGGAITAASGSYASGALSSGSVASGAYASGSIGSGAMVDLGAIADAAATAGSTGTVNAKLRLATTQLATINTTLGSPFQAGASIGNTTFAVTNAGTFATQLTGATNNINNIAGTVSLPTGASTAAKQPALGTAGAASADVISVQGITSMTPLLANPGTAANWGVGTSTQNSASVANGQLALGQFNTTPTTITTGNMSPLQMDNAGNLLVNIKAGAGSGGTALADGATFTEATTNFTPVGGEYVSGGGANCTTGKGCTLQMTIDRAAYTNSYKWAGGVIGAMANYGTSPGAVLAPGVNAFVTNSNANGSAVSASSSPVVIASDQAAVATKAASTAFASGSLVDITNMSAATAAAPPAKAIYLGANASGATGGLLAGLVQCDSKAVYDASTSGSTELVALTSGRSVYVCGYTIMAGGTVNVKLIYGTGTACATGSNNLTPAYQLTAQAGVSDPSPFYRGMKTASANALCINASTGVAAQAIVYYSII